MSRLGTGSWQPVTMQTALRYWQNKVCASFCMPPELVVQRPASFNMRGLSSLIPIIEAHTTEAIRSLSESIGQDIEYRLRGFRGSRRKHPHETRLIRNTCAPSESPCYSAVILTWHCRRCGANLRTETAQRRGNRWLRRWLKTHSHRRD